jgi:hypothetical protein
MRFVPRLTYSNVVATLAIFIALGGISYAATSLSKNSVGSKQLKKNAVTSNKIKKNAVTASKIKKNAVATAKIKGKAVTEGKIDPKLLASIEEDAELNVLNGDGSVLGTLAGVMPSGLPIFQVMIDGGIYTYYPSGQLIPLGSESPSFKDGTCTGTAYVEADADLADLILLNLAGGPTRVVFREFTATTLGPISAWKFTKASEIVAGQNLWELETSTGDCVPTSGPFTGTLVKLDPVAPPPDGIAPLTIG